MSLEQFVMKLLSEQGMTMVAGAILSFLLEVWPWFKPQTKLVKRLIVGAMCFVVGIGAAFLKYGSSMGDEQILTAAGVAFVASQVVDTLLPSSHASEGVVIASG